MMLETVTEQKRGLELTYSGETDRHQTHNLMPSAQGPWESRGLGRIGGRWPCRLRLELRLSAQGRSAAVGFYLGQGGEGSSRHAHVGRRPSKCESKNPTRGDNNPGPEGGWSTDRPWQSNLVTGSQTCGRCLWGEATLFHQRSLNGIPSLRM